MTELALKYKQAEELIFQRWSTEKDSLGRSQEWKITAINEDRTKTINSGLLTDFINEIEHIVDLFENTIPTAIHTSTCNTTEKVAVEPITPR